MPDPREARPSGLDPRTSGDPRGPFQIDRDRLLYSTAFRRLAGVTQVVSPGEGEIFHNRLTHSLKVAQIGRRMAEDLSNRHSDEVNAWGGLDPDVVEAAGLAHDLGHPPFGHIAEEELNDLIAGEICQKTMNSFATKTTEGYEGNAQSFRIITALGVRRPQSAQALDLTRAVLNATLKYPWRFGENPAYPKKYGVFGCDQKAFAFARANTGATFARSLEAQIMDWADDITYSIHDTEDFYRAGLIPLDRLATPTKERERFLDNVLARAEARQKPIRADREFLQIFNGLFNDLGIRERFGGTREQQELMYQFTSNKIGEYARKTKLLGPPVEDGEALELPKPLAVEIMLLKELTWTYVIENPALAVHQHGQRRAIRTLFQVFNEAVETKQWKMFPAFFRERAIELNEQHGSIPVVERVRLVADTIAGLTDRQALLMYQQLSGLSQSSMLDPVAPENVSQ